MLPKGKAWLLYQQRLEVLPSSPRFQTRDEAQEFADKAEAASGDEFAVIWQNHQYCIARLDAGVIGNKAYTSHERALLAARRIPWEPFSQVFVIYDSLISYGIAPESVVRGDKP